MFKNHDIIILDETYLRRWFVATTRWGCVYLHKICKNDRDSDPHDHPWDFTSLILWGGYNEELWKWDGHERYSEGDKLNFPGGIVKHRAEDIHWVRLFNNGTMPAWTLILRGTYRRHWNFIRKDGPVLWRKYLDYWGPDTLDPITRGDVRLSDPVTKE